MDISIDISSSDGEGLPEMNRAGLERFANAGKRTAAAIIAHQAEDRPLSKRNLRNISFASGTPTTQYDQAILTRKWDTFCGTIHH